MVYKDEIRCHFTDGFIFIPDTSYILYSAGNFFKWKYPFLNTVEFKLSFKTKPDNEKKTEKMKRFWSSYLWFVSEGENQEIFIQKAEFSKQDWIQIGNFVKEKSKKLEKGILDFFVPENNFFPVIVECSYDTETSLWVFHKIREDKNKPNFVSVAFETILSLSENLTYSKLEKHFSK